MSQFRLYIVKIQYISYLKSKRIESTCRIGKCMVIGGFNI